MFDGADPLVEVMNRKLQLMRRKHAQTREYMEMNALRGVVKDGAGTTLYNYFTEFGLAQISVKLLLGTAGTNVQGKVREVLRSMEDNLLGESMSDVHALVSREFFDKLIAHPKTEEAYKFYAATGAQPLRQDVRRNFPFRGHRVRGVFGHGDTFKPKPPNGWFRQRRHRIPAGHHGHVHHLWRPGQLAGGGQHHGATALCASASRQRPLDRSDDRGLDPAGKQAAAHRDPYSHFELTGASNERLRRRHQPDITQTHPWRWRPCGSLPPRQRKCQSVSSAARRIGVSEFGAARFVSDSVVVDVRASPTFPIRAPAI